MKTVVIAEAGVNHNGSMQLAKQLIEVAAQAGANYVKFQSFSADQLVIKKSKKAKYQIQDLNDNESQHSMLSKLELSESMISELIHFAQMHNIGFLSSAFDIPSLKSLHSLGQEIFKVPSGEITNLPYLRELGLLKKRIILSTGMSNLTEIQTALQILQEAGTDKSQITVLQCTSAYPTPISDVNLLAMLRIKSEFGVDVGFSDHTLGIEVALAAVALGASVIEKHFTLDKSLHGPDHKNSLQPEELEELITRIKSVELALGDGKKRIMPSEKENLYLARKSIVASRRIHVGEVLTEENVSTKRPSTGISPMHWHRVIGSRASREFQEDENIEL